MVLKAKGEIKKNSIKIVYATAPPFSVLIGAAIVKKLTKTKLILDIKDDWIHQNRFKSKNLLLRKIELSLEKFCIKTADKVILVTKSSLNDFSSRYPSFKNKFYLIPNGCDLVEFKKHWSSEETRNEKFTIIHAGVINAARDPENLFIALKELKDSAIISSSNFQFVFIGPLPNSVTDSIAKLGLNDIIKNIQYLSNISSEYILKLASADLLLAINYPIKTLIPAKLYDYWASRSPIILLDEPDTMAVEFINEYKLGKTSSLNDIEGLKNSILSYFDDWKNNIRKKRQDTAELEKFDRKYLTQKLIEIFQELS
jgi:glycosyltransferase involved in cell wall biosynthesis